MTNRITKDHREAIESAVLAHRFKGEALQITKDRAAFALAVYEDVFSADTRRKMNALPDGWLTTDTYITVAFNGRLCRLPFGGAFNTKGVIAREDMYRVFPANKKGVCLKTYDAGHELSERWAEIENRIDDFAASFEETRAKVRAALASSTTFGKLVEGWPEIEPFVRSYMGAKPQLPALPVDQLNKLLGLPVSEQKITV